MSIPTEQLDTFIDTTIQRLSSEAGVMRAKYRVDLRDIQQRITQPLVDKCVAQCSSLGLEAERTGDSLVVTVDLHKCVMNVAQAKAFNSALDYTRVTHGNQL